MLDCLVSVFFTSKPKQLHKISNGLIRSGKQFLLGAASVFRRSFVATMAQGKFKSKSQAKGCSAKQMSKKKATVQKKGGMSEKCCYGTISARWTLLPCNIAHRVRASPNFQLSHLVAYCYAIWLMVGVLDSVCPNRYPTLIT